MTEHEIGDLNTRPKVIRIHKLFNITIVFYPLAMVCKILLSYLLKQSTLLRLERETPKMFLEKGRDFVAFFYEYWL